MGWRTWMIGAVFAALGACAEIGEVSLRSTDDVSPSSCSDGITNGDETDTDCGGSCGACELMRLCIGSQDCQSGSCDDGVCYHQTSCSSLLATFPDAETGNYQFDSDGLSGPEAPGPAYCDMETAGGGWQLFAVADGGDPESFVGMDACIAPDTPCRGSIPRNHAGTLSEVLIRSVSGEHWLVYHGFSTTGALAFLTLSSTLGAETSCSANDHVCGASIDPDLAVSATSGFVVRVNSPLKQWWNKGGWWVGANPDANYSRGRIHATTYGEGYQDIRLRADTEADTQVVHQGPQALFHRRLAR